MSVEISFDKDSKYRLKTEVMQWITVHPTKPQFVFILDTLFFIAYQERADILLIIESLHGKKLNHGWSVSVIPIPTNIQNTFQ